MQVTLIQGHLKVVSVGTVLGVLFPGVFGFARVFVLTLLAPTLTVSPVLSLVPGG
jgi:hypothetical protein